MGNSATEFVKLTTMQTLMFQRSDGHIERLPFLHAEWSPSRTYVWATHPEPVMEDGEGPCDCVGYPVESIANLDELFIDEPVT